MTYTLTEKEVKGLVASYVQLMDGYTNLFVLVDSIMALLNEKELITYTEIHDKVLELSIELKKAAQELKDHKSGDVEQALAFNKIFGGSKISDS